jgi:DNA-binding response OmpR family regulator
VPGCIRSRGRGPPRSLGRSSVTIRLPTPELRVALETIAEAGPDLILLDLHMPQLDGLALLQGRPEGSRELSTCARAYCRHHQEGAHPALAAGTRDFLTKPFAMTDVLLRVGNLLETRELHQSLRGGQQPPLHRAAPHAP